MHYISFIRERLVFVVIRKQRLSYHRIMLNLLWVDWTKIKQWATLCTIIRVDEREVHGRSWRLHFKNYKGAAWRIKTIRQSTQPGQRGLAACCSTMPSPVFLKALQSSLHQAHQHSPAPSLLPLLGGRIRTLTPAAVLRSTLLQSDSTSFISQHAVRHSQ